MKLLYGSIGHQSIGLYLPRLTGLGFRLCFQPQATPFHHAASNVVDRGEPCFDQLSCCNGATVSGQTDHRNGLIGGEFSKPLRQKPRDTPNPSSLRGRLRFRAPGAWPVRYSSPLRTSITRGALVA
jgi:hypothetical protein